MPSYEYQAVDEHGNNIKGIATGSNAKQIRSDLRAQDLLPLNIEVIEDTDQKANNELNKVRKTKISNNDLAIFTRQIATLLGSGLTIEETLNAVIAQSEGHKLKSVISDIRSLILEGHSLSESISLYPKSFPEIYRSSIFAGEQSGNLDEVLDRLSDYLETRHNIQQKINVALVYPIFLTITSISIVVALVAFVVPKVVKVFEDTGQDLPMLTKILINLSSILQQYGLYILLLIFIIGLCAKFLFKQDKPRYWLHSVFLNTTGTKRLVRNINTARMARTLAIMVGSGVPLLTSMKSSLGVLSNVVLQNDLRKATNEVAEGISVSRALSREGHFPPLLIQMVASGENNGQLSKMLEKAATATENELQSRIAIITSLFEPIMILVMGLVVLVIVLAILLPIFDLNQIIS